jgi:hypothetical protein
MTHPCPQSSAEFNTTGTASPSSVQQHLIATEFDTFDTITQICRLGGTCGAALATLIVADGLRADERLRSVRELAILLAARRCL